ncbi:unnamed protein product [Rangifer tarandus platyrhynchus]|uniref:Uncharacterized protein n=2 Tax=Rangifer tarandus platyrhynchus TaxID=3082113 RepID=A0ACB0EDW8_RANTA|nr:unnamed protein product [Rangifer tarandus platyrhynchus]CAI9698810.1 unnamed protein product [Rangifer tarandus platyrhynchus]
MEGKDVKRVIIFDFGVKALPVGICFPGIIFNYSQECSGLNTKLYKYPALSDDSRALAERGSYLGERKAEGCDTGRKALQHLRGRRGHGKDAGCQSLAVSQLCSRFVLLVTSSCRRAERNVSPLAF